MRPQPHLFPPEIVEHEDLEFIDELNNVDTLYNANTEIFEPRHEISNNVVCATSKGSDQPAHTRSLIRAVASRLNIL